MGEGFQFIDIIFLAMIAAFLVLRLRSVLGRRDGHDGSGYSDPFKRDTTQGTDDKIVHLPDRSGNVPVNDHGAGEEFGTDMDPAVGKVQNADAGHLNVDEEEFLVGARVAFEMILTAFATGDRDTLKALLSKDVFDNFDAAISDREVDGLTVEDTLVGIRSAQIEDTVRDGNDLVVTVRYVTEQVNVTRDSEGNVVDGDPNKIDTVTDLWSFSRDIRSADPNWTLVATRSLD